MLRAQSLLVVLSVSAACGTPVEPPKGPAKLPPLTSAPLTTERTWKLSHPHSIETDHSPLDPRQLSYLLDAGFGDVTDGPGDPIAILTFDGGAPPPAGANRKRVTRFVHLADTQLADDESPGRLMIFDTMGATGAAFRPQEAWGCVMLNAAVRTINALHAKSPLEFVVLGGDNADNAQINEQTWFRQILDGAPSVECDSGGNDDPKPGPDNDPKDPFFAEGLKVPWRWVTGNHDILNQGNFPTTDEQKLTNVGTRAQFGARDWSSLTSRVVQEMTVVADTRREPYTRANLLEELAATGDGHGLKDAAARVDGKAFYAFDVADGPVRIVVLDTAAETGASKGVLHRADVEARVRPLLAKAETDGKYVILVSHHAPGSLSDGTGLGGVKQADAMTADEWRQFLGGFPHVMMHLAGHSHEYRSSLARPVGGHPFWEVESASLADWPGQLRLLEVWDEDNGYLKIRALPVDYAEENDALAAEFRRRAAADYTAGWAGPVLTDRGVIELWFPR
jgi:3',5'-cyclic AMP phosphodiesterase CpdA